MSLITAFILFASSALAHQFQFQSLEEFGAVIQIQKPSIVSPDGKNHQLGNGVQAYFRHFPKQLCAAILGIDASRFVMTGFRTGDTAFTPDLALYRIRSDDFIFHTVDDENSPVDQVTCVLQSPAFRVPADAFIDLGPSVLIIHPRIPYLGSDLRIGFESLTKSNLDALCAGFGFLKAEQAEVLAEELLESTLIPTGYIDRPDDRLDLTFEYVASVGDVGITTLESITCVK